MTADEQIAALIGREGGYSDHPADKGGPTMWGITEQVARAFGYAGAMRALPRDTAFAIYRRRYWYGPGLNDVAELAPTVAAELFDAGVNMGPAVACRFLQRALNVLNRGATDYPDMAVDGLIGPLSLDALRRYAKLRGAEGEAVLLWLVRAFRACRYAEIAERDPSQEVFEYGWIARQVRGAAA